MARWTWVLGFTGLIALGITGAGVYYVAQTLDATRLAVTKTSEATEAMQDANEIAVESAERSQRAYALFTKIFVANLAVGEKPRFVAEITNTGSTPAHDFCVKMYVRFANEDPETAKFPVSPIANPSRTTIAPGNKAFPRLQTPAITQADWSALKAGTRVYVLAGAARYTDVFGKRHTSMFRAYFRGDMIKGDQVNLSMTGRGNRSN